MTRRSSLSIALVMVTAMRVAAAAGVLAVFTVVSAQQIAPRAVATTADIMTGLVAPSSTVVFRAAADPPREAKDWIALRAQALLLAESGNLLLIGTRARDEDEWARQAAALRDAAEGAAKAAAAKDATALSDAGERVYETCEQCHQQYLTQAPL
jgi:hypothetical protein